ncbi:uncharacterized protein B0T15DRAFT_218974 [Chaetomium strumarium]|uniref:SRR1-like domain-containing protein n=1 Tax=Chaetomium strumarium TaxID=1170767 RepID=A0AAJ0M213_9PEZI|nr:hypothetical protein B0T15DRAFT_218974 [Chaetomium strumarium]
MRTGAPIFRLMMNGDFAPDVITSAPRLVNRCGPFARFHNPPNLEELLQTRALNKIEMVIFIYDFRYAQLHADNADKGIANFDAIVQERWMNSPARRSLYFTLSHYAIGPVTTILGFGLGSFMQRYPHRHGRTVAGATNNTNTEKVQHGLLLDVRDTLQAKSSGQISILAQDPESRELDQAVLRHKGIDSTVHPLEGFIKADNQSFVVSIDPDVPAKKLSLISVGRPQFYGWIALAHSIRNRPKWTGFSTTNICPSPWSKQTGLLCGHTPLMAGWSSISAKKDGF